MKLFKGDSGVFLLLIVLSVAYLHAWYQLRKHVPNKVGAHHLSAFLSGGFLVGGVFATPFAHLDHRSLTGHMVQHLVLMTIAAPLILLGHPSIILWHSLPRRFADCVAAGVREGAPICRFVRFLAQPVRCWLAGTSCVILWHIPAVFALGRWSESWHEFELATFLGAGILFWWPVIKQWPSTTERSHWLIPLYLFLATLPCDTLSAFLTFCGRVVYSGYESGPRLSDNSALKDQEFAGSIMWVWVTFVYLIPAVISIIQRLSRRNPSTEMGPPGIRYNLLSNGGEVVSPTDARFLQVCPHSSGSLILP